MANDFLDFSQFAGLDSSGFGDGLTYDQLIQSGEFIDTEIGGDGDGLTYLERLTLERLEEKKSFTQTLARAAQQGADLSKIPQGIIRYELHGAEQDIAHALPPTDWAEQAEFEPTDWEQKLIFRCSSLGSLMTKQDGGRAVQKRLDKARAAAEKARADFDAAAEKDAAKGVAKSATTMAKENAKIKAESVLADAQLSAQILSANSGAGELSATAKKVCEDLFAAVFFGRGGQDLKAMPLLHGTHFEQVCLDRYGLIHGLQIQKNEERLLSGLLTGECDVNWSVSEQGGRRIIRENKAPISAESFVSQIKKSKSEYYWQVQGYLHLYGADEAHLMVNLTPNVFQAEEVYDHLPASYLVQTYSIKRSQNDIDLILAVLKKARAYTLEFGREIIATLGKITPLEFGQSGADLDGEDEDLEG